MFRLYRFRAPFGLALNDYVAGDGAALFAQACAMPSHVHAYGVPIESPDDLSEIS